MEQANQRYLVNNIVNEALAEVDRTLSENLEALQDPMFESALIGLKQRKMTYEKDPLLPMIRDRIQSKISKLNNMTEEEYVLAYCRRDKLVQLSNDQLEMLRTLDRQLRDEFLRKIPKLDQSIKQYPHVKHTLDNWGKDFQEKAHA